MDNSPVAGMQFEYGFDNLGNRNSAKSGGNSQGGGLRESTYLANSLNQYTQHTVPGAVDVVGTANATATVTVNNQTTSRTVDYFHKALALENTAAPVYSLVDVVGVKTGAGPTGEDAVVLKTGSVYVPKTPEPFTHDADGNLTSDGRWTYAWDGENRLIAMEAIATVPAAAKMKLEFAYDSRGRRVQKIVYNWNIGTATYQLQSTTKFIYDGWNLLAELDGSSNPIRSYIWGQDLSGKLHGAAGIGGLLLISEADNNYLPGYDGSGNIKILTKVSSGALVASYEFSPFGETLAETGVYAEASRIGFSTKYSDEETGLLYYGLRYYNPYAGRWTSRDPLTEMGGVNLYAFVSGDPVGRIDPLGMVTYSEELRIRVVGLERIHNDRRSFNVNAYTELRFGQAANCERDEQGCYRARVQVRLIGTVYLPFANQFSNWFSMYRVLHELGHYRDAQGAAKIVVKLGEVLESRTFSSRSDCEGASETFRKLASAVYQALNLVGGLSRDLLPLDPRTLNEMF